MRRNRVVTILGARWIGKTTLARQIAASAARATWFDLEDDLDLARLSDPMLELRKLTGLVVIDEVQRQPGIFPALRVLADQPRGCRFLLLGSASPSLVRHTSETLAGRVSFVDLRGLGMDEVGGKAWKRLWLRGGLPRSYTARSDSESAEWRRDLVRTFLQLELAQLAIGVPASALQRLWYMLAHWHGQVLNSSQLAGSLGVSDSTVRRYLDLLAGTYVVRILQPWHENMRKRQVRSPKVYIADTGILHSLLGIHTRDELERHPKVGSSWESFAMEQVVRRINARVEQCYFWSTHGGAELDLLVVHGDRRFGFEFKRAGAPVVSPSMRVATRDLRLESLDVIYPGEDVYFLSERIRAVGISRPWSDVSSLRGM